MMDIYELLVDIIKKDGYKTIRGDFSDSNKERLQTQSEKDIFELIKNICSMSVKYEKDVVIFDPAMIWYDDGTRSYGPQDLRDEDYDKLENLDIEKLPTVLAARIADLLWIYRKKYKMAEKAIELYRRIFVEQFDSNRWTKCVEAIKRSLVLSAKLNKQELLKKDCECIYEKICELNGDDPLYLSISLIDILYEFKGEEILMIAQCVQLYEKEDLKKRVLEESVDPISSLFGMGYKDEKGRTIIDIPALDINDPTGNIEVLELHMHSVAKLIEEISGNTYLKWSIELLNKNHKYEKNDLKFLVEDNPIIPVGRANIILSAIYYGLKGDIYLALHILAPQTENMFRTIAEYADGTITTLKDDGSSEKKLLSKVFDMPELIECYDNDILFLLKGLLNEKAGANIRNEIAHGIMGERNGNSGCSIYFFCLFLKILSFTLVDKEHEADEDIAETEEIKK